MMDKILPGFCLVMLAFWIFLVVYGEWFGYLPVIP